MVISAWVPCGQALSIGASWPLVGRFDEAACFSDRCLEGGSNFLELRRIGAKPARSFSVGQPALSLPPFTVSHIL